MIALTRRDITDHQAVVPWQSMVQVEQDLVLCRTMQALFADSFLDSQIAMRGGTLLHKVHLAPAARYSEDIDLVVVGPRPAAHIEKALQRVLREPLGRPVDSIWDDIALAIRNTVKPSRVLRMTFAVPSVVEPGNRMQIVVEANTTERTSYLPVLICAVSTFMRCWAQRCGRFSNAGAVGICSTSFGRSSMPAHRFHPRG